MCIRAIKTIVFVCCLTMFNAVLPVEAKDPPKRIKIMQEELVKNFEALKKEPDPPYFMSYSIDDVRIKAVSSSFGARYTSGETKTSFLRVEVRTGDYSLDSSHEIRGDSLSLLTRQLSGAVQAPIYDSPDALRIILWRETDKAYKNAVKTLAKVKSQQSVMVADEDKSDDFSKIKPQVAFEDAIETSVNFDKWETRVKKYTNGFKKCYFIRKSIATFSHEIRNKYYVNSEGTSVSTSSGYMSLIIQGRSKLPDGMDPAVRLSYFGFKESDFPSEEEIMKDIQTLVNTLEKLYTAPIAEPYTGPAIFTGKASGVFFSETLGSYLEGQRQKGASEGQTLKKQVGKQILPEFMSVVFDPTIKEIHGLKLSGSYSYDDEGTKSEKVICIENGILKNFLMSRTPIENFHVSNGHGRSQPGTQPVSRQSNLIVESRKMLSENELRQKLIEECKKQGKDFGLLFTEFSGGSASMGRSRPNAFNITPNVVYKVFTDGRPDELIRGVNLIGTPLTTFGKIIATGSKMEAYNMNDTGGSVPVPISAVSPSILISEIEIQKSQKSQTKPPILPSPALR